MNTKPLTDLLPSLVAAGIITTVFSASSATNMIHRYSFNEPVGSTTVTDSIRGSNGVVRSTPIGTLPTSYNQTGTRGRIENPLAAV